VFSGLLGVDDLLEALNARLVVVAASPASGKTAWS
jgi:hypothetical protein